MGEGNGEGAVIFIAQILFEPLVDELSNYLPFVARIAY